MPSIAMSSSTITPKRPNFLVIVADDLGFSDPGCFGSEIHTPHLDSLASSPHGLRLTNFHTASMCSPTRSMLLSGTDHHVAGLGQMEAWGRGRDPPVPWAARPGYEGYLHARVAALPEVLRDHGYHTLMSGKWHLGLTPAQSPHARGFARSWALLPGGASHFAYDPRRADGSLVFAHWASLYREDARRVDVAAELAAAKHHDDNNNNNNNDEQKDRPVYYSSDHYATKMIQYLRERDADPALQAKPFFAYLAFTAPHWPLQAPRANIDRYRGMYDDGPDRLREKRLQQQHALGLLPRAGVETAHPVVADGQKEWAAMTGEEQAWSARTMEVYAGMVDRMDEDIGRVLQQVRDSGEWDDTVVVFMSDNGAEGAVLEAIPVTGDVIKQAIDKAYNNDIENLGNFDSFVWYGPRWAQAATAPSRMHKGYVTEGGIRCPAIVHYPGFESAAAAAGGHPGLGRISTAFATVMDIMPTILDLAGIPQPGPVFRGREVVPIKGKSWVPFLRGETHEIHGEDTAIGWELFFHQAIRRGKWKAVFIPKPRGPEKWQLYDMEKDMGETNDLAEQEPEVLDQLIKHWLAYVSEFGVFLREELEEGYALPPGV